MESKQGIKKEDQGAINIVSRCAKYVETALKWLSSQDEENEDMAHLYTVLKAQMQFLQTEYAGLVVKGTFDGETAKIFKCLQKNSLAFRGEALSHLRSAAEISAARGQFNNTQQSGFRGRGPSGYRYQRGRGRQNEPYRQYQRPFNIPAQRSPSANPNNEEP